MPNNRASSLTVSIIDRPLCLFEGLLADVHSPLFSADVIPGNLIGTTSRAFTLYWTFGCSVPSPKGTYSATSEFFGPSLSCVSVPSFTHIIRFLSPSLFRKIC